MQRIQFYAGEERHVRLRIHAEQGEFTIRDARWKLQCSGQLESSGECIIEEHIIDAFIAPGKKTDYELEFSFRVADETRKEKIEVAVR